jgi:hypothetical protein
MTVRCGSCGLRWLWRDYWPDAVACNERQRIMQLADLPYCK